MSKNLTSCGTQAYSSSSSFSSAELWKNYSNSMSAKSNEVITPILEAKNIKYNSD
jgi:hypothetical protein